MDKMVAPLLRTIYNLDSVFLLKALIQDSSLTNFQNKKHFDCEIRWMIHLNHRIWFLLKKNFLSFFFNVDFFFFQFIFAIEGSENSKFRGNKFLRFEKIWSIWRT
jgi:hypothetical protein